MYNLIAITYNNFDFLTWYNLHIDLIITCINVPERDP